MDDAGCERGEEDVPAPGPDAAPGVEGPDDAVGIGIPVGAVLLEDGLVGVAGRPVGLEGAVGGVGGGGSGGAGGAWVEEGGVRGGDVGEALDCYGAGGDANGVAGEVQLARERVGGGLVYGLSGG